MNSMIGGGSGIPPPQILPILKKIFKKKLAFLIKILYIYLYRYGVHLVSITFKAHWEGVREGFKSPVLHVELIQSTPFFLIFQIEFHL